MKTYFIKESYTHRQTNTTLDQNRDDKNYWDKKRIDASYLYQYSVYEFARKLIFDKKIKSVLDVGCGPATKLMELLYPICNDVVGIDQPQVIRYCNEKFKDTKAQFVADNFEDPSYHPTNPFDLIICSDVIEHIEDPDILLNYIKSFAGKETYIIISTPERDILRGFDNTMSPKEEHLREWNQEEFKNYLTSHNFEILFHKNTPFMKMNMTYPFVLEYTKKTFLGKKDHNQLVLCKFKGE